LEKKVKKIEHKTKGEISKIYGRLALITMTHAVCGDIRDVIGSHYETARSREDFLKMEKQTKFPKKKKEKKKREFKNENIFSLITPPHSCLVSPQSPIMGDDPNCEYFLTRLHPIPTPYLLFSQFRP